jgi:hypothetical protein
MCMQLSRQSKACTIELSYAAYSCGWSNQARNGNAQQKDEVITNAKRL